LLQVRVARLSPLDAAHRAKPGIPGELSRMVRGVSDSSEVLVLGAGFSHAVSPNLPLANHLGEICYARAADSDPAFFEGAVHFSDDYPFEVWLSLLAEDQPHLREDANLENAARFAKLKRAIVEALREAQAEAFAADLPQWFLELLTLLHQHRTTAITLNYDTLIEVGIERLFGGTAPPEVDASDLLDGQPPLFDPSGRIIWNPRETMRLLKLHGSLNWWWVPDDQSGATLVREPTSVHVIDLSATARGVPGREPFIIPPLATKSRYYHNPLTRQLWHDAYEAVAKADHIALIGYSLPQTDIVTAGMLGAALSRSDVHVEVVNPKPALICKRIAALGGPTKESGRLQVISGKQCLSEYVRRTCNRASASVAQRLATLRLPEGRDRPDPVWVAWRTQGLAIMRGIDALDRRDDSTLMLLIDNNPALSLGGRVVAREVVDAAHGAQRLVARTPEGFESTIIDYSKENFDDPNALHVLRLVAAGQIQAS